MTKAAQEYLQSKGIFMPDEKRRYKVVGSVYILHLDNEKLIKRIRLHKSIGAKTVESFRRAISMMQVGFDSRYYNF